LEGEIQTKKGTSVRHALEVEGLITAQKQCEDELERSMGASKAQVRELGQLKGEKGSANG
jgi:hypothetical protein